MKFILSILALGLLVTVVNTQIPAEENEFPYYALFTTFYDGTPVRYCGAGILSSLWVVTEAYCGSAQYFRTSYTLTVGTSNFSSPAAITYELASQQLISHPQFTLEALLVNNIALVRLNDELEFSSTVQPLNRPLNPSYGYEAVYLAILPDADGHLLINRNQLELLPNTNCYLTNPGAWRDGEICVTRLDFCDFHFGGIFVDSENAIILGISNVMSCDDDESSHLTSIFIHNQWISSVINGE